jgi:tetratricopeptide (TPR) repeat protein
VGIIAVGAVALLSCTAGLIAVALPARGAKAVDSLTRARRLLDAGRTSEAKGIFAELLKADPKNADAVRGMASALRDEGSDEAALPYWEQLTRLRPDDFAAHKNLALAAWRCGRDMEAMSAASAALSLAPEGDEALTELLTKLARAPSDPFGASAARSLPSPGGSTGARLPQPPDPTRHLPTPGRPR